MSAIVNHIESGRVELSLRESGLNRIYYYVIWIPFILYLGLNLLTWGLTGLWVEFTSADAPIEILLIAVLLVAHELLHVLGFVMAGVKPAKLTLSFLRENLSFELACDDVVTIGWWRIALILPCLVLTPLLAFLAASADAPNLFWLLLVFSTTGCAFDIAIFAGLLGLPSEVRVRPELHSEEGRVYVYEQCLAGTDAALGDLEVLGK
jgi:hypothetical protein